MSPIARRYIGAAAALVFSAAPAAAAPDVVVSIAPVHSLVAAVMSGAGEPKLLVPPGASPHAFSLRPSDASALANADIVFRVGADLETFLEKPFRALAAGTVVTLATAPGITQQKLASDGASDRDHDHAGNHTNDPHIWLSVANARRIAEIAAQTLRRHDPANSAIYERNLSALSARLFNLEHDLRDLVRPLRKSSYVVQHDAYSHFEVEFGLKRVAAISLSPERRPGARRLFEIRNLLVAKDVRCVFAEPQFPDAIAASVTDGTNARLAELDPIGADLAVGPELYFELMTGLGNALADCLTG